ncbi:hypothetical protein PanWU01x14_360610 [Parasponia andersonii]|uniref:Uncharacterized protein n=1 Tax=Parasponia andersonii TaxID=3476 RepID=A0A2P5A7J6_PARAD|nr:hypothetical protein PanWU01x14_360610 [Parasponia andersonii]
MAPYINKYSTRVSRTLTIIGPGLLALNPCGLREWARLNAQALQEPWAIVCVIGSSPGPFLYWAS